MYEFAFKQKAFKPEKEAEIRYWKRFESSDPQSIQLLLRKLFAILVPEKSDFLTQLTNPYIKI